MSLNDQLDIIARSVHSGEIPFTKAKSELEYIDTQQPTRKKSFIAVVYILAKRYGWTADQFDTETLGSMTLEQLFTCFEKEQLEDRIMAIDDVELGSMIARQSKEFRNKSFFK